MADTFLANRHLPPCPNCGRRFALEGEPELLGRESSDEVCCSLFEGGCGYHFVPDEEMEDKPPLLEYGIFAWDARRRR